LRHGCGGMNAPGHGHCLYAPAGSLREVSGI